MRTKFTLLFVLIISGAFAQSQNIKIKSPLSQPAFDSLVIGNLNFMVLGEDNIKQGISYEYKESSSEINLSGKLLSNEKFIMTVDGKFSVDSGAFIFDETDGSKAGKLTLNFFINLPFNSKFYHIKDETKALDMNSRRAMLQNKVQTTALADTIYHNIMGMEVIMKLLELPYVSINDKKFKKHRVMLNKFRTYDYNVDNYNSVEEKELLLKKLKQYYKKGEIVNYDALVTALLAEEKGVPYDLLDNDDKIVDTYAIPKGFKLQKFLKDYQDAYSKMENYITENNKLEIVTFKNYWTGHRSWYLGVSPFYERQGFDIYNPNLPTITSFKDRFNAIKSDLYGFNLSLNHVRLLKNNGYYIARLLSGIGRSNNFTEYDKNDYSYTSSSQDINGVPIEVVKTKTGYINRENRNYQYGIFTSTNLELYFSPFPIVGVFGKIGYFKSDALLKQEAYPFETGILINLKSKEKKNIVAVQLFMSRMNLNVHPDDDMNFGLKVGLPINLRKD